MVSNFNFKQHSKYTSYSVDNFLQQLSHKITWLCVLQIATWELGRVLIVLGRSGFSNCTFETDKNRISGG